jgi:hypothetical protein
MENYRPVGVETRDSQETADAQQAHEAHLVQLYSDDGLLLDVLADCIRGAIAIGDGGIVVATKAS